ncbi:3-isopropylmalate dehydratase [Bacillus sp. JJ1533]|uniref:3-isopropylmalate dehydratase n=1 Tax=Bacillus sp. JJ1533 TaxID=3122959 RepID=UPI0030004A16
MLPIIKGRVAWVFDEPNFDIDLIVGVSNMKIKDIEVLKSVCMKDYDKEFSKSVRQGDIIVGGENFGYGHPHYPAFIALRALGISGVIAESFAPGFYRGETSNGFTLIECPTISTNVSRWDVLTLDWEEEVIKNETSGISLKCLPIPEKTKELVAHGGIVNYLRENRLASNVDKQT